jgi:hypothetical protein
MYALHNVDYRNITICKSTCVYHTVLYTSTITTIDTSYSFLTLFLIVNNQPIEDNPVGHFLITFNMMIL